MDDERPVRTWHFAAAHFARDSFPVARGANQALAAQAAEVVAQAKVLVTAVLYTNDHLHVAAALPGGEVDAWQYDGPLSAHPEIVVNAFVGMMNSLGLPGGPLMAIVGDAHSRDSELRPNACVCVWGLAARAANAR